MKSRLHYICDQELLQKCDKIPAVSSRVFNPRYASMVHALIESYGLINHLKMIPSVKATSEDLKLFHSSAFVGYIENSDDLDLENADEEQLEFGLCYDCPPFSNLYDALLTIVGGSITGAASLTSGEADIAINWTGGWHHAQRDEAEGFCYVNDIVIAIEKLKERFKKILYIDLDIHHGNGVENAFAYTKRVFTLSFHKHEAGFYPGTGSLEDIGIGPGKGFACNIPFREGISDQSMLYVFEMICPKIFSTFQPDAVVVQCGSDCLNGDPLGMSNLTHISLGKCTQMILDWNKPTLFLGGGGYNFPNTARLWTYLTAVMANQNESLSMDIPDNDFFLKYGPDYQLNITKGCQKDTNTQDYLNMMIHKTLDNLKKYVISVDPMTPY